MKKKFMGLLSVVLPFVLVGCGKTTDTSTVTQTPTPTETTPTQTESTTTPSESTTPSKDYSKTPKIYLAGDSTVKTYEDNQFIGGWGQYLDYFLDDSVEVINCAQGGRSSRSFINEGRLFDIEGNNYSFTQNGGNSIGDVIAEGDFLMIQFGHNDDDTKKASSYSTLFDRMVPLGEPDANGIYPVTAGEKAPTTHLPEEYTTNVSSTTSAYTEIAKYGSSYYSYDCGGTYKWFLKQYIDFARSEGAVPVLVTPVARVKFSGDEIIGGAGLHGENFAYVEAVRQLAEEEDCLLVDLFAETKTMLETTTSTYANYLMALKPNDLTGTWPESYDSTYGNSSLGYTGVEATHYNKYGAFLTSAKVAEAFLTDDTTTSGDEYYCFRDNVNTTPKSYIDPSNLISKSKVVEIERLFQTVNVTNPSRSYSDPNDVVALISALENVTATAENYVELKAHAEAARVKYNSLNIDDRDAVTNIEVLDALEVAIKAVEDSLRPAPVNVVTFVADSVAEGEITSEVTVGDFKIVGSESKVVKVMTSGCSFTYSGEVYETTQSISLGGSASFGTSRYIEFSTTGKCTITVVAKSTGSSDRTLALVEAGSTTGLATFDAKTSVSVTTVEIDAAGTYQLGSTGSGIYVYEIIIEYFA